jgi:glycosyltransferase involved in cell wall biosynthesis
MRIGIDARLWNESGIGRYIRNICLGLQKIDSKNDYVLFVLPKNKEEVEKEIIGKNWKIVSVNIKWHSIKEQTSFPRVLAKENLDLAHFPYQQSVPVLYKRPYVVTIHDLIKHHFVTGKSSTNPYWLLGFKMLFYKILINQAARNAKKIITVSNTTKDEIFDHLMVNKKNIEVIYEAADDFSPSSFTKLNIGKYFLFVGNVYPHKNPDNLIKAFKIVSEKADIKLVFVGRQDYFYKKLKNEVSSLVREGKVIFIENADDKMLSNYYENSICLIRPSLMEGFSLPPLEAMSCGTLVMASDIPVHRELFDDNVFYFDPKDSVDMSVKMLYVLNLDEKVREEKITKGKNLAKKFRWEDAARKTLKIYEGSSGLRQVE